MKWNSLYPTFNTSCIIQQSQKAAFRSYQLNIFLSIGNIGVKRDETNQTNGTADHRVCHCGYVVFVCFVFDLCVCMGLYVSVTSVVSVLDVLDDVYGVSIDAIFGIVFIFKISVNSEQRKKNISSENIKNINIVSIVSIVSMESINTCEEGEEVSVFGDVLYFIFSCFVLKLIMF